MARLSELQLKTGLGKRRKRRTVSFHFRPRRATRPEVGSKERMIYKIRAHPGLHLGFSSKSVSCKLRVKLRFYVFDLFDRCDLDLGPIT